MRCRASKWGNDIRGALFIFWVLATLSVLRCHLKFALESLIFLTITTFRTFCHLSVICVVLSDLKIVSQQKMELTRENFCAMIYYDIQRGLSRPECIHQLISTFGDEAPSYVTVKRRCNEFNCDWHSLTNGFRKDRSKSVAGPENNKVRRHAKVYRS